MRHLLLRGRRAALLLSLTAALLSHPLLASASPKHHHGHGKRHGGGRIEHALPPPLSLDEPQYLFAEPEGVLGELETERVMIGAMSMLGTHYKFGSKSSTAVDCSSLMQLIYHGVGLDLPRTTREQIRLGEPVHMSELRKGDLLFYRWRARGLHVAIYMDNGYILHASPSKGKVVMTQLNPSWRRRLVAARRVL